MSSADGAADAAPITHLLYLHGFRSSPQSTKANKVGAWIAAHRPDVVWWCPQLAASPAAAMRDVFAGTAAWPSERMGVIGSSLGGFYATVVAERRRCRAVLLNPAVDPARDLASAIGTTTTWHSDEPFDFRAEYVDELRTLAPPPVLADPDRILAVIATGDEVLSWQEMRARYRDGQLRIVAGSDHALSDFDAHLPAVLAFLGLDVAPLSAR
ncbi:MAG TPA: YqiA/YcfP family alpha/beta fold hydrolase [Caldimonas sp.]|jgi:hypothetical protein